MLKELRIRNLAIIDDLAVRFEKGLNIISGETGAGKSIIVDALGLALGDRAQADLIKSGKKEATVQAFFELQEYGAIPDIGIDMSEGLLLRRVLSSAGKSRAYINDTMVTLQTLSEVSACLVDIHSQHEHQSLLTAERQTTLLDYYGNLQEDGKKVASLYDEVQAAKHELAVLKEKVKERAHRTDLLRFQIQEIQSASLKTGEQETLQEERQILSNMNKLIELTDKSYMLLYNSEESCTERLSQVIAYLKEVYSIDDSIEETFKLIENALPMIEDAAFELRGYRDRYEFEPDRLELIDDRLELIKKLEKKYGEGTEAIHRYLEQAETELEGLEESDERLAALVTGLEMKEKELIDAALALSDRRKETAEDLEKKITRSLRELAIGNAGFRIDMRQEMDEDGTYRVGLNGIDRIEFLFSANPGEPLKPLRKIISGGELSRVMLALKSILADVDNVPVLIFDEVDAGIGGKTAESVGRKLDKISEKHQLLCITHLPQIASFGDFHLKIEKREKDRTVSVDVIELYDTERTDEIARMLSGKVTDISRKHAGELLERVK